VVSILARNSPEEFRVGARDFLLVGRERTMHHLWNGQPMDELLELSDSTYAPTNLDS
jgi:hypothetical protein